MKARWTRGVLAQGSIVSDRVQTSAPQRAGSIVELTDVLTEDILIPTEDVLIPLRIPTASDNILVRFTVGITRPAQTIPLLHRSSVLLLTHLVGPN